MENSNQLKFDSSSMPTSDELEYILENFDISADNFTQADIIEALNHCLAEVSPLIKPTKLLKNMVYYILKSFFIDKKKYVIANCPTGSGKTIIGFMTYFCFMYLLTKKARPELGNIPEKLCYFLTSNKALQEQIANDIKRFEFYDYLFMLKGVANYECIEANKKFKVDPKMQRRVLEKNPEAKFASYEFRPCLNMSAEKIENKFGCLSKCPYKCARAEASQKSCTILNYAYFLNVLRETGSDDMYIRFFGPRLLTISDEAHLIPDIVCNMFNYEFTNNLVNRIAKLIEGVSSNFGYREYEGQSDMQMLIATCRAFFFEPVNRLSQITSYVDDVSKFHELLKKFKAAYNDNVSGTSFNAMFADQIVSINEHLESILESKERLKKLIAERPEDVYFESEETSMGYGMHNYKHILKDLKEAEMVKQHFLSNIKLGLFMSATIGDVDEYAKLMGIEENEYAGLMLPSTFDFSKSPIYLCKSGYLNYQQFDRNIDKILLDVIKICNMHPNEKGIIHSATFKINNLLKEKLLKLGNTINQTRFLFYNTAQEKEIIIKTFINSMKPYILVGPSLYEGLDLAGPNGRFNILIKVPYAQINGYVKRKMQRYPFWYQRNCIEKIIQAIGRTNRFVDDYSIVYLLDSLFDKIIWETTDDIVNRIESKTIY